MQNAPIQLHTWFNLYQPEQNPCKGQAALGGCLLAELGPNNRRSQAEIRAAQKNADNGCAWTVTRSHEGWQIVPGFIKPNPAVIGYLIATRPTNMTSAAQTMPLPEDGSCHWKQHNIPTETNQNKF